MELTEEQLRIINSEGDIKINAVAGSGKTTTIIEYANTRPANSRILYLAFNKSVKLEAQKKFEKAGLRNVRVETAHSLAYRNIVRRLGYNVRQGYKTYEVAELLGLQSMGEKHAEYILASHVNKSVAYFCNSSKERVQDLNYLEVVSDKKAHQFASKFYKHIERYARILLGKMNNGEIDVIHDFYLKKFQLSNPVLPFNYILFDEGQDASPAMLDIFLKQKAVKVIVGDTYQQIYGWRYAINSLERVQYKDYKLSTSFRFSQDIANLAMEITKWQNHIEPTELIKIKGAGTPNKELKTTAVVARTNLGLLKKAIEYIIEKQKVHRVYFEGNFSSYTYADDGASLYDVLNLFNGKRRLIKDKLIKSMRDINDLEEYIDNTGDAELAMMVEIVNEYGDAIPDMLKTLKEKHIGDDEKETAEMIFSTVHRCKGMEYDTVLVADDFLDETSLEKLLKEKKEEISSSKLKEEINLLYVAVTRAKSRLHIPETLIPKNFPSSTQIQVYKVNKEEKKDIEAGAVNFAVR